MNFIKENISTIIVGSLVFLAVVAIAMRVYQDKKSGKSSCGCNCKGCPSTTICHKK
ncbi:MAG: FeoB-associated Cys-rich membrane protein [Filifactoraceae bacterium]